MSDAIFVLSVKHPLIYRISRSLHQTALIRTWVLFGFMKYWEYIPEMENDFSQMKTLYLKLWVLTSISRQRKWRQWRYWRILKGTLKIYLLTEEMKKGATSITRIHNKKKRRNLIQKLFSSVGHLFLLIIINATCGRPKIIESVVIMSTKVENKTKFFRTHPNKTVKYKILQAKFRTRNIQETRSISNPKAALKLNFLKWD